MEKELKLLIAGEGGQGVQALGKIISDVAYTNNLQVSFIPNYGVEQRGGVTLSFIRLRKKEPIVYPKFSTADILVWLSERSIKRTEQYLGKNTKVIYNSGFIKKFKNQKYISINFDELANNLGNHRTMNMIVLGMLMNPKLEPGLNDWLNLEKLKLIINQKFEKYYQKNPKLKQLNEQAFNIGYQYQL